MVEKINGARNGKEELESQAELNILREYGFTFDSAHLLELKGHCIHDNTRWFIDNSLTQEIKTWRKNNTDASAEEERKALTVLIETISQDYKYGRVDKQNMPDAKEGDRKLLSGEITPEDYQRIYIDTHEPMVNQLDKIVQGIQQQVDEQTKKESVQTEGVLVA